MDEDERDAAIAHWDELIHQRSEAKVETQTNRMTKGERTELGMLIRKREKMLKSMADEYGAKRLAEFETQIAAEYSFDQDEVWEAAADAVNKLIAPLQRASQTAMRRAAYPSRIRSKPPLVLVQPWPRTA
jgi:hypothetical protein